MVVDVRGKRLEPDMKVVYLRAGELVEATVLVIRHDGKVQLDAPAPHAQPARIKVVVWATKTARVE